MKTCKLLSIAVLAMAMSLVSCSGDDGEQGPQGVPGKDGTNGTNGEDGTDGTNGISCWDLNGNGTGDAEEDINQDGNFDALDCQGIDGTNGTDGVDGIVNVQQFSFNLNVFANYSSLQLDLLSWMDNPSNYVLLYYMDHNSGYRYSIPGPMRLNQYYSRVYTDIPNSTLNVYFYSTDTDVAYQIPGGEYTQLLVVAIELTNGAKNSENVMADLKAAGVDTADYHAVAKYFGLE